MTSHAWPDPTNREWVIIRKVLSKTGPATLTPEEWTALAGEAGITDGDVQRIVRRALDNFKGKLAKVGGVGQIDITRKPKMRSSPVVKTAGKRSRGSRSKKDSSESSDDTEEREQETPSKKARGKKETIKREDAEAGGELTVAEDRCD